jgi:hypothetical protein
MDFSIVNKKILVLGKTNSGKSVLIKYIVSQHRSEFDKIFVICPTEEINGFYSNLVPDNCIFSDFKEDWLTTLIQKLTAMKKEDHKKKYNVLLILDDLGSDVKFSTSPAFTKMMVRGRHISLSLLISAQYLYQVPPICRSNICYLIVGQQNNQSQSILADEFLYGSIDRKEFMRIYHDAIKDYGFLLINCNSVKDTSNLNSIYGVLKTPPEYIK